MKGRYVLYLLIFIAGTWGGNELVKYYKNQQQEKVDQTASEQIKLTAVDFSLPDIEGKTRHFNEWAGKVRVLNFWATWCPPCVKETPMFVEMQEKYGDRGLQFIGVAIDDKQKVIDFMDTYGVNYPMLIGAEDAIKVAEAYGDRFGALPYTVVIDRNNKIIHAQGGEMKREKTESILKSLLPEP